MSCSWPFGTMGSLLLTSSQMIAGWQEWSLLTFAVDLLICQQSEIQCLLRLWVTNKSKKTVEPTYDFFLGIPELSHAIPSPWLSLWLRKMMGSDLSKTNSYLALALHKSYALLVFYWLHFFILTIAGVCSLNFGKAFEMSSGALSIEELIVVVKTMLCRGKKNVNWAFSKSLVCCLLHYWRCRLSQRSQNKEQAMMLLFLSPQSSRAVSWTGYIPPQFEISSRLVRYFAFFHTVSVVCLLVGFGRVFIYLCT